MAAKDILTEAIVVQADETVSAAIGRMEKEGKATACVFDKKRFAGLLSHKLLFRSRIDVAEAKVGKFVERVAHLSPEDGLRRIAGLMLSAGSAALPVLRGGKLLGVVEVRELLAEMAEDAGAGELRRGIGELAREEVSPIGEEERVGKALHELHGGAREAVLVDKEGKPSGIVRVVDVLRGYYAHHQERNYGQRPRTSTRAFKANPGPITELPAGNFLPGGPIVAIERSESGAGAARKMAENGVETLLILDIDGKPQGAVTARDLLKVYGGPAHEPSPLRILGLDALDLAEAQRARLEEVSLDYVQRLVNRLDGVEEVVLHLKAQRREGTRQHYEAHARVVHEGSTIAARATRDWDAITAARQGFDHLLELARDKADT